jgi:hypothetical protein
MIAHYDVLFNSVGIILEIVGFFIILRAAAVKP